MRSGGCAQAERLRHGGARRWRRRVLLVASFFSAQPHFFSRAHLMPAADAWHLGGCGLLAAAHGGEKEKACGRPARARRSP
jgi:hypothetical protein